MKKVLAHCLRVIVLCSLAVFGINSYANATTLTFDELPFRPVNGLSFMGVNFGFQIDGVDSTDANYHSSGPGNTVYVQDPSLEGNADGILSFDFTVPVNSLSFGTALNTPDSLTPGFQVELFAPDDSTLLGVTEVNTTPLIIYSENQFNINSTPIGLAKVSFNNPGGRFALDNLTYNYNSVIPEPATLSLLGLGLMGLVGLRRKTKV